MSTGFRIVAVAFLFALVMIYFTDQDDSSTSRWVRANAQRMARTEEDEAQQTEQLVHWLARLMPDTDFMPGWLANLGISSERLRELRRVQATHRDEERIDRNREHLRKRLDKKNAIVRQLAQGELGLVEAARQYQEADADVSDEHRRVFRDRFAGRTDLERYCHRLVEEMRLYANGCPEQFGPVVDQLRKQIQAARFGE